MSPILRISPNPATVDVQLGAAVNWLQGKYYASQAVAFWVRDRSPLPVLGQARNGQASTWLVQAINNHLARLQYHSDPAGGTGDLYNHPEHTQYLLERQGPHEKRPRDCDDFAVFARALAVKAGVRSENVWIWNLIVANQFRDVAWNHVICGFRAEDAPGKVFVLDTCSAAWKKPWEFVGTKESVDAAVRRAFGEAYRDAQGTPRNYAYLIEVQTPF